MARASGPKAMVLGGMGFAAFSCAIDLFLRRETAECVFNDYVDDYCSPHLIIRFNSDD